MFFKKNFISFLDFCRFDEEHYVIGQNDSMLRIKAKQHGIDDRSQDTKIKYKNYWADHILQGERLSVAYAKVSEGIIKGMIHGFDNIILACGPNSPGETFNIMGWNRKYDGIVPRLIEEMLAARNGLASGVYTMSCVEIKDNRLFDLLNDKADRPCLIKNVSEHEIVSFESAKNVLWEANAKRTVYRDADGVAANVHDFVITLYWNSVPKDEDETGSKCAKVQIVELAGVGPTTSKPLKHQIQANRNVLELSQFLKRVSNVNIKDNSNSIRDYSSLTTSTLLKYCQGSFCKQNTTLRVICYIRPDLEFLKTNLSVLKFGEMLRELPATIVTDALTLEPKAIKLYKKMVHLAYELHLYEKLTSHGSMTDMTERLYDRIRVSVSDFVQTKSDDITLPKWSYPNVFIVLSVFKEYFEQYALEGQNEKNTGHLIRPPNFPLQSTLVDHASIRQTLEVTLQTVEKTTTALSNMSVTRRPEKSWEVFVAQNPLVFVERERMSAEVQKAQRLFETYAERMIDVQDKLIRLRDHMDELRSKRHIYGNERYDQNMDVIVPPEEKRAFLDIQEFDAEMMEAITNFNRSKSSLDRHLANYSKLNEAIRIRFEGISVGRKSSERIRRPSRANASKQNLNK